MKSAKVTHRQICGALVAALLVCAPAAMAQPPASALGVTYIHAGRLLDRPGSPPRGSTTIIVRDGKIAELRDGYVAPPAGERLIDLKDRFVLPGLIDAHVHLGGDSQVEALPRLSAYQAQENARVTLLAGFTTVRNIGDFDGVTLALREAIKRGWVIGPRILDAGAPITTTLGHGDNRVGVNPDFHAAMLHSGVCDGADECRRATRLQIGMGADVIKIITTGLSAAPVGPDRGGQMTLEEARAVVETAHGLGRKVAAHAHGGQGLRVAVDAGVDSIEHGTLMNESDVAAIKKSGAYYVPALSTASTHIARVRDPATPPAVRIASERRLSLLGKGAEMAAKAGVPIVLGTDAGVSKHGENALEIELLSQHGLSPMGAIAAGTTHAAALLGLSSEVGSIEPTKDADIIAVSGDPLRDPTVFKSVRFVMRGGKVYKSE